MVIVIIKVIAYEEAYVTLGLNVLSLKLTLC